MRASVAMVVLACFGCADPDDIFPLSGALESGRAPVAGRTVELRRAAKPAFFNDCADATSFKSTETDGGGAYGFELFRAQAQSLTGGAPFCFRLHTRFESGVEAVADLLLVNGPIQAPTLPDWDPALEVSTFSNDDDGGSPGFQLRYRPVVEMPPAPQAIEPTVHRATLRTGDGGVAWEAVAPIRSAEGELVWPPPPLRVSGEALEDFDTELQLVARAVTSRPASEGASLDSQQFDIPIEVTARQQVTLQGRGAAASRGAACAPFAAPCPFTDGALTPVEVPSNAVTITFPRPLTVRTIIVRGLTPPSFELFAVHESGALTPVRVDTEVSLWPPKYPATVPTAGPMMTEPQPVWRPLFVEVSAPPGLPPVAAIRLSVPSSVLSLSEISVFE